MRKVRACIAAIAVTLFFSSAYAGKPINVGLVFNFDGKSGAIADLISGMEWKALNLKKQGIEIEFVKVSSTDSPLGAREAIQKLLISGKHFDAIIAELDSSKAFAAAEVADEKGQVMFTPLSTSYKITEKRNFIFSGTFSDRRQGKALAEFSRKQVGARSAAIITDASQLYSTTLSQEILFQLNRLGIDVREHKSLKMSDEVDSEVRSFLIKNSSVDAIFLPLYSQSVARVLQEAKKLKISKPAFIGGDAWGQYGRAFDEIVFGSGLELKLFWASHEPNVIKEPASGNADITFGQFRPGVELGIAEAAGADVIGTLVKAVLEVKKAKGSNFSQRDLASHIRGPGFFYQGLLGKSQFSERNENLRPVYILGTEGGKKVLKETFFK